MFQVGDVVRVLDPFTIAFPEQYPIEFIKPNGVCQIAGGNDFNPQYLEKVI